jgi:circadian clock protein KaiB
MTTHGEGKPIGCDHAADAHEASSYELTLFVSGASDLSARAITNARTLLDLHLGHRYRLAVVDVHQDPGAALSSNVVAVPTLVKHRPLPVRKLLGDLSDDLKIVLALGLPEVENAPRALG